MKTKRLTPEQIDEQCLRYRRQGIMPAYIRVVLNVSLQRVYDGIDRARQREGLRAAAAAVPEPKLEPLFPITSFTPQSRCPHHGPIAKGSVFVCMVCNRSGKDHHRALRLLPGEAPPPDNAGPAGKRSRKATRKSKFGDAA
jgi:hypothetical protein